MTIVLSLFDYSGIWSQPYRDAGYLTYTIDIKNGVDLLTWDYHFIPKTKDMIVLIAMPCTDYALSGAKYFFRKDCDGTTEKSQTLMRKVKEILDYFNPRIWCLENPMTRIHKLNPWLGEVKFKFQPYEFGDDYQKTTWLFGKFNTPVKTHGTDQNTRGNFMFKTLGGKSDKTKEIRSNTSKYFSEAFFKTNP